MVLPYTRLDKPNTGLFVFPAYVASTVGSPTCLEEEGRGREVQLVAINQLHPEMPLNPTHWTLKLVEHYRHCYNNKRCGQRTIILLFIGKTLMRT